MTRETKLTIAIWTLVALTLVTRAFALSPQKSFCEGWDEGYQQALEDCLTVALTPLCPLEPINSNGYKTGYGLGYAQAKDDYCE